MAKLFRNIPVHSDFRRDLALSQIKSPFDVPEACVVAPAHARELQVIDGDIRALGESVAATA
jgi:hypothetical protein